MNCSNMLSNWPLWCFPSLFIQSNPRSLEGHLSLKSLCRTPLWLLYREFSLIKPNKIFPTHLHKNYHGLYRFSFDCVANMTTIPSLSLTEKNLTKTLKLKARNITIFIFKYFQNWFLFKETSIWGNLDLLIDIWNIYLINYSRIQ